MSFSGKLVPHFRSFLGSLFGPAWGSFGSCFGTFIAALWVPLDLLEGPFKLSWMLVGWLWSLLGGSLASMGSLDPIFFCHHLPIFSNLFASFFETDARMVVVRP